MIYYEYVWKDSSNVVSMVTPINMLAYLGLSATKHDAYTYEICLPYKKRIINLKTVRNHKNF